MLKAKAATIDPKDLYVLLQRGEEINIVDVRTPAEFRSEHIPTAQLAPLDTLDARQIMTSRQGLSDVPLYLTCRTGNRAAQAQKLFVRAGFNNVVCIEGGTEAWEQAGLPVVRGKAAMPLDRQVRIAAGSLVLLGVALGLLLHSAALLLSGAIGAGLIYAGITGNCMMARLLGKLPWNQDRGG
jgi:rhodanese-related sulfurtransferase